MNMAKGKNSRKEEKKPKKEVPKTVAAAASTKGSVTLSSQKPKEK